MRRRQALLSLSAALPLAGCLGLGRTQPQPRLAWIWLQNDRQQVYEVGVVVEEDGTSVFSGTYQLGATMETATITVDHPVDGPGDYVVRARLDGQTREVRIAEVVDGDENCVGVRFSLLDDGSVGYWTKAMEQC
ncbi:MAG: hypothetical protein R3324_08670 [Halobacteriales archaeon]|nr:hypothetical protein [Halobacteriales archaeon]